MKKILAMILCLALLGSCAAFAETAEKESIGTVNVNGAFNIKCKLAEDYTIAILQSDNSHITAIVSSEDPSKPMITLSIAFNELYTLEDGTALRYNDISEEDVERIKGTFTEVSDNATFEDRETAFGTKLLVVRGDVGDNNYLDVYTIYNSYEVEVVATAGTNAEEKILSEEQLQTIIDFLSDMDFEAIVAD